MRFVYARFALTGALLLAPALVVGEDRELASAIERVTVFADAAVVTRRAPVDLSAGASSLVLRGLPGTLDPASIRVEGEGTDKLCDRRESTCARRRARPGPSSMSSSSGG